MVLLRHGLNALAIVPIGRSVAAADLQSDAGLGQRADKGDLDALPCRIYNAAFMRFVVAKQAGIAGNAGNPAAGFADADRARRVDAPAVSMRPTKRASVNATPIPTDFSIMSSSLTCQLSTAFSVCAGCCAERR